MGSSSACAVCSEACGLITRVRYRPGLWHGDRAPTHPRLYASWEPAMLPEGRYGAKPGTGRPLQRILHPDPSSAPVQTSLHPEQAQLVRLEACLSLCRASNHCMLTHSLTHMHDATWGVEVPAVRPSPTTILLHNHTVTVFPPPPLTRGE